MEHLAAEPLRPPTFRDALGRLRAAQKPRARTPFYLRYVNRRLGGWLAASGYARGLRPDQLTAVSAAFSLAGAALLVLRPPGAVLGVGVAGLLLAGYAFDSADGQLARLRGGGSPAGEWLDHVVDAARTCLLHSAVLVGLYRFVPDLPRAVLVLPLVFVTAAITLSFATMLRDQLLRAAAGRAPGAVEGAQAGGAETGGARAGGAQAGGADGGDSLRHSLVLAPVDFGTLGLAFVLYGAPAAFVSVYGTLAVLHVLFVARLVRRTRRVLSRL